MHLLHIASFYLIIMSTSSFLAVMIMKQNTNSPSKRQYHVIIQWKANSVTLAGKILIMYYCQRRHASNVCSGNIKHNITTMFEHFYFTKKLYN